MDHCNQLRDHKDSSAILGYGKPAIIPYNWDDILLLLLVFKKLNPGKAPQFEDFHKDC